MDHFLKPFKDEEAYIEMLDDDLMYPQYEEGDDEMLDALYMYDDEFYDRGVEMDGQPQYQPRFP